MPTIHGCRAAAEADRDSVVDLTRHLVESPTRGGVDDYTPAVDLLLIWLDGQELRPRVLEDAGLSVAVMCDIAGEKPGPHLVLDACLDTAAFGDESAWTRSPTSAELDDCGWLHGRGTSDSKVAVAIFSHLAARLARMRDAMSGTLTILFDLDEHTGGFAGVRRYLDEGARPDGVMIGYPGLDTVVTGGRGFLRLEVTIHGTAEHSASRNEHPVNAVSRAGAFLTALSRETLPAARGGFPPAKLTPTSVVGGQVGSFSVVPDQCAVQVDIRLNPGFDAVAARELIATEIAILDRDVSARPTTVREVTESWPPFRLPDDHPLPAALVSAARHYGLDPVPKVAGPSNIGNLLAGRGIPATAGFGVRYRNLHAVDEAIEVATIAPVQATYHRALLDLLREDSPLRR